VGRQISGTTTSNSPHSSHTNVGQYFTVTFQTFSNSSCNNLMLNKVKVKGTLVQAMMLCTGRTAHRGSRGIALLFHDHGTRRGWGVSVTIRLLFTPRKDPVPIVQEAGWAPGPAWTGAENLAPNGIRSTNRAARSQSLYRLHYPTHLMLHNWVNKICEIRIQCLVSVLWREHMSLLFTTKIVIMVITKNRLHSTCHYFKVLSAVWDP